MQINKFFLWVYLLLLAGFDACAQQSAIDTTLFGRNAIVGKYAKVRGFNMYYEIYGKGQPVLFIHGNGGSMEAFTNQVTYFTARNYMVILADSRAQGKSIDSSDSLSYEMMADDFNALLDVLHIKNAFVVGWSDGGINGLLLAMRHPGKVNKLAIIGANLWADTTGLVPFVYNDILSGDKQLRDSITRYGTTPELTNAYKINHLMVNQPNIKLVQLHGIKCPTLVIAGDHDAIPVKHTVEISENIPQSYLWIIPNSGHSTLKNYKEAFNKTIDEFFSKPYKTIEGTDRYN